MPNDARAFAEFYETATGHSLPEDRFAFGDTPDQATDLAARVRDGRKVATSSLLLDHGEEALPRPGDRSVILDGHGRPVCVIETTHVETRSFLSVDATFAAAEGEGDGSLAWWRTEHERFFRGRCADHGTTFDPTMPVVCEQFAVVWQPAR